MKGGGLLNVNRSMVLFFMLLGGLTISAHCARVPDLTEGSREQIKAAENGSSPTFCYQTKCGRIPLPCFCCVSPYTPVRCLNAQDKCERRCRPPSPAMLGDVDDGNRNAMSLAVLERN
ncbi:hypothetical protein ACP70R_028134 [Stipagrostis hirtigluma subsp. patula]